MRQLRFNEARAQKLDARPDALQHLARLPGRQRCGKLQQSRQIVRQLVRHVKTIFKKERLVAVHLLRLLAEVRALLRRQIKIRILREVEGPHIEIFVLLCAGLFHKAQKIAENSGCPAVPDFPQGPVAVRQLLPLDGVRIFKEMRGKQQHLLIVLHIPLIHPVSHYQHLPPGQV